MRISAKADYAVRALLVLARLSGPDAPPVTVNGELTRESARPLVAARTTLRERHRS